ncbi:MAG: hypothetical protein QG661_2832 [Actinomycetota bacterium]|nr:hypothetical protein [Actinomycetota bacterium]
MNPAEWERMSWHARQRWTQRNRPPVRPVDVVREKAPRRRYGPSEAVLTWAEQTRAEARRLLAAMNNETRSTT